MLNWEEGGEGGGGGAGVGCTIHNTRRDEHEISEDTIHFILFPFMPFHKL